ncbi:ephrin-B3-like isoform X2 [Acropora millepora]|uniref:ephrin-B3-like isoform X2 n=1 Tax=Acropora millepora TaxID=45264 RepID=UPI001CF540D1|nr:ephrin-B3-like isoform X2 [Acropora millepora]
MESSLYILLGLLVCLSFLSGSDIYPSIHWIPQNPLFETDGNICGPGPRYLKVQLNSKISFICPNLATVLQKSTTAIQTSEMYENLWFLENKTAFDACDTSLDPKARRLLTCSSPTTLVFSTMIFLQFTAEKDGLVFQGGRTYYLIATSDGTQSHLNDRSGGHCNDTENNVNMKIEVYVCKKGNQTATDPKCAIDVGNLRCPSATTVTPSSSVADAIASSQTMPAVEESSSRLTLHPSMSATVSASRQSGITKTDSSGVMTSCPNICDWTACFEDSNQLETISSSRLFQSVMPAGTLESFATSLTTTVSPTVASQDMCERCKTSCSSNTSSILGAQQEQLSGNKNSNSSGAWRTTALFFAAIVSLVFMGIIGIIIYKNNKRCFRRPRRGIAPCEGTSKEMQLRYSEGSSNQIP